MIRATVVNAAQVQAAIAARLGALVALAPTVAQGGAEIVEAAARANSPVDTGLLQGSIDAGGGGAEVEVQATAPYAGYQEYGTYKMSAQPFMGPAARAAEGPYYQLATRTFAAALI